ncbi:alpha/beta hydrolase family protein [Paludisphaera soli]|uniref:alpha/beta hydrolase family protein n=1 Tax=Paludisphaera soli TaxID=2712865 RepID=UPI0013EC1657|nr:alpha/beta fold hydrolase [Paludisphaera soli]
MPVRPSPSRLLPALLAPALLLAATLARADDPAAPLPRKPMLGAAMGPVTPELQASRKLDAAEGAAIVQVIADSSVEAAGLKPGDVITAVDGEPVKGPLDVVGRMKTAKAGDRLAVRYVRDGGPADAEVVLKEKPRRQGDGYEVLYDSATSLGHRLRTIVTRPAAQGKRPALLMIQGLGNFSIDAPGGQPMGYDRIVAELTKAGYVVMQVDKPGCGDSEGGPWPEIDFRTELDGYRQALKALKSYPFVDPDRVFLFGHSMGGVMAPVLAAEEPVRGLAVYGTVFRTWFEYQLENIRRQSRLAGADFATIERQVRDENRFLAGLYLEKKSPADVLAEHPELRGHAEEMGYDGTHLFGGHYTFFQQLAELNMPEAWAAAAAQAHALAIWGKGDYVAPEVDHRMIAEAVDAVHPGGGTFVALDCDHGFSKATSFADSFGRKSEGEFNPAIIETLKGWMDRLAQDGAGS